MPFDIVVSPDANHVDPGDTQMLMSLMLSMQLLVQMLMLMLRMPM